MNKEIAKLHYITQETKEYSHQQRAEIVCRAGINWVQLRVKGKSDEEYLMIAKQVKLICDNYDSKLIINDNVEIAKMVKADGVHLGKSDMRPGVARKELGNTAIIGGTANTYDDIIELTKEGVDYIGLGPFKNTTTKKNLSPILGLQGYVNILAKCKKANISTPIIAIGGIQIEDVSQLTNTGTYGIAIASAINESVNITGTAKQFNNIVNLKLEKTGAWES